MTILLFITLVVIGLFGGVLAGFLGVGGGIIFVPTLLHIADTLGLGGKQAMVFTIANSLVITLISGLMGSYKQYKNQNFHFKTIVVMGLAGMVAAVAAAAYVVPQAWYNKAVFTQFFCALMLFGIYKVYQKKTDHAPQNTNYFVVAMIGLVAGGIAALSGLGGGIIMIPLMTTLAKFHIKKATSVSLGAIVPISLAMAVYYSMQKTTLNIPYSLGMISFSSILPLAIGVVLGAPHGVKLSTKSPEKYIRWAFVVLATLVVFKMVFLG